MTTPPQDEPVGIPGLDIPIWTIGLISDEHLPDGLERALASKDDAERAEVEAADVFTAAGVRLPHGTSVTLPEASKLFTAADKAGSVGAAGALSTKFCVGGVCLTVQSPFDLDKWNPGSAVVLDREVFRRFQLASASLLADEALMTAVRHVATRPPEGDQAEITARVGALGVRLPAGTRISLVTQGKTFVADKAAGVGESGFGYVTVCFGATTTHCVTIQPVFVLEY